MTAPLLGPVQGALHEHPHHARRRLGSRSLPRDHFARSAMCREDRRRGSSSRHRAGCRARMPRAHSGWRLAHRPEPAEEARPRDGATASVGPAATREAAPATGRGLHARAHRKHARVDGAGRRGRRGGAGSAPDADARVAPAAAPVGVHARARWGAELRRSGVEARHLAARGSQPRRRGPAPVPGGAAEAARRHPVARGRWTKGPFTEAWRRASRKAGSTISRCR
jgi:hypothetical protein